MEMTVKEVFILSVMLSFSHSLILESAIAGKIGVNAWLMASIRLGLAFFSAFFINLVWNGGGEVAKYGMIASELVLNGWADIVMNALSTSFIGIVQLAIIVIPIMIGIQILKDVQALPVIAKWFRPFTKVIGVSDKTGVPLMAGIIFGIAFGAGVIIQAAKEENLSKKDLYLVSIFLVICHAVIEDTLIFIPLGINVLPLLLIRLGLALFLTALIAHLWVRKHQEPFNESHIKGTP
jgi:hypothetical protein